MIRLPRLGEAELEAAKAAFSEQALVDELTAAPEDPAAGVPAVGEVGVTAARLYAYAAGDLTEESQIRQALLAKPGLRRTLRQMIEAAAHWRIPEAIAASSTEFPERHAPGCILSVVKSHSGSGCYYLVIEVDAAAQVPKRLFAIDPDDRVEQVSLPAPSAGVIQVMIDEASGIPAMLRDPKTAVFLR
jgi:hypothetical protein